MRGLKYLLFLTFTAITGNQPLSAQEFTVDNFLFTPLDDSHVELTKFEGKGGAVLIPETVTDINSGKEYTVKTIGKNAFMYKSTVSEVTMPNSITKIGEGAFNWCGASKVVMSENIDTICAKAFRGSSWYLSTINFPERIKYIGDEAFYGLYQISCNIYLPKDIYIGDRVFYNCSRITEVTIEGTPSHIGDAALNLIGLTTVNVLTSTPPDFDPSQVFTLEGEPILSDVTLNVPTGAKENFTEDSRWNVFGIINEKDFNEEEQTPSRKSIEMEEAGTLEELLSDTDTKQLRRLDISGPLNGDDIAVIRSLTSTSLDSLDISNVKIVEGGDAYYVSLLGEFYTQNDTIGECMFYNCSSLKYINMPKSVTCIGDNAFKNCTSLAQVIIGENTKSIGSLSFSTCYALKEINIPNSVTDLGSYAFASCNALQNVTLSENITKIKEYTFYFCSALQSVNIPESVESIMSCAFFNCQQLTNIFIPKNVKSIELGAFDRCYSLEAFNVDTENQYYTTENGVLFNKEKSSLERYPLGKTDTAYTIPESVIVVQPNAFWEANLQEITMSDNTETLGENVFAYCENLVYIRLSEKIKSISKNTFLNCSSLKEIQLPQNLEEIKMQAFMSTTNLQKIIIPERIRIIGEATFWGCTALEEVTLPANVELIEGAAFFNCSALKSIYLKATIPPVCEDSSFDNVDKGSCTLFVPTGSVENYKETDTWKDFIIQGYYTGINKQYNDTDAIIVGYYTLDGKQIEKPQKGIYIARMSDGSVKKILISE